MSAIALTRRGFLHSAAALGTLSATTGLHGCATGPGNLSHRHTPGSVPTSAVPFPTAFNRIDGARHGVAFPAGITLSGTQTRLSTAESSAGGTDAYLQAQEGATTFTTQASDAVTGRFFNGRRVALNGDVVLSNDGVFGGLSRFNRSLLYVRPERAQTLTSGHMAIGDTLVATTADYDWNGFSVGDGKVIALNNELETINESESLGTNPTGVAFIQSRNELVVLTSGEWTDTRMTLQVLDGATLQLKKSITITRNHIGQLHDTVTIDDNAEYAYVGTSDLSGLVYRVDLTTFEVTEWQTGNGFIAGLALSSGVLYAANFDRLSVTATQPDFSEAVEIPLDFTPGPLTALTNGGVRLAGQDQVVDIIPN